MGSDLGHKLSLIKIRGGKYEYSYMQLTVVSGLTANQVLSITTARTRVCDRRDCAGEFSRADLRVKFEMPNVLILK